MTETEGTDRVDPEEVQRAKSDLHPGDPVDDMRTAEYGRESAAARADTSDDTPTPRETPAD